jgi:hypothetical protein
MAILKHFDKKLTDQLDLKFIKTEFGIIKVLVVGDVLVEIDSVFKASDYTVFHEKREALYSQMVKRMAKGLTRISNFKGTEHYHYYLERLTEEHPEYLI